MKVNVMIFVRYKKKTGGVHSGCRNLKLAVSYKEINEMNWFLCFDINSGKLKVIVMIGPLSYRGSYKSWLSVSVLLSFCLSIHPSSSAFSSGMAYHFYLIFHMMVNHWKNVFQENSFLLKFG